MFGFAKNEMDDVDDKQLATLQNFATAWLEANDAQIAKARADGLLLEVKDGE